MLFLGAGYMLAYSVLVTAIDYYDAIFSDYKGSVLFYVVPTHRAFLLLALCLMLCPRLSSTKPTPWHWLISAPFVAMAFALCAFPFLSQLFAMAELTFFALFLSLCAVCGFCGGVAQCALTSFCNFLPPRFMRATIAGQAMAAQIVIRVANAKRHSAVFDAKIYFVAAGAMLAICAALFVGAKRTKLIRAHFLPFAIRSDESVEARGANHR